MKYAIQWKNITIKEAEQATLENRFPSANEDLCTSYERAINAMGALADAHKGNGFNRTMWLLMVQKTVPAIKDKSAGFIISPSGDEVRLDGVSDMPTLIKRFSKERLMLFPKEPRKW